MESKTWAFSPLLFHRFEYLTNHFPEGNFLSFTLEEKHVIFGVIHFHVSDLGFTSMAKSPFGGMAAHNGVSSTAIHALVKCILKRLGGAPTTIFLPFQGYPGTMQWVFEEVLIKNGFAVDYQDLQQYLVLDSVEKIQQRMHISQKRRLKKSREGGFVFAEEPAESLAEIHSFITGCRIQQGLTINISRDEMIRSAEKLPGIYKAFSVRDEGRLIAACIASHVSQEVLYYYLPGSAVSYKNYSPMVMLLFELALWARDREYEIIDLGKSSLYGEEQAGLAAFKRRMGAVDGRRLCLVFPGEINRK